jgi:hypothetical protein
MSICVTDVEGVLETLQQAALSAFWRAFGRTQNALEIADQWSDQYRDRFGFETTERCLAGYEQSATQAVAD